MENIADLGTLKAEIAAALGQTAEDLEKKIPTFTDEHIEAFYTLGYDFYESGKYQQAASFFQFLTMIDNLTKKHWIGLAASLQMMKEYEKAINTYGIAALLDQTDPYTSFYAAECCFSAGDIERGMDALEAAEELASEETHKRLRKQVAALRQAWGPSTKDEEN